MGEHGPDRFLGARTVLCCALALIGTGAATLTAAAWAEPAGDAASVTISGSVSDATGRPLAGAQVSLAPVMDDFQGYTRRLVPGAIWAEPVEVAVTGDDGRYALTAVAGERWRVIVDHPAWATVTRRLEPIHHDREIEPVSLRPSRELEVRVRSADGRPVAGARLMAYSGAVTEDLWPYSWTAGVTDSSGVARVKVARPGPWFAEVAPGGLPPADAREHGRPPVRVEIPEASPRSLRVLRSSGEPAADAVVFRPGKGVTLTRTDADGRVTLHGEPGSRMTVSVLTADGESANPSVAFPGPEDSRASDDPRTVHLQAPLRLTVTVMSADGSGPVAGAVAWGIDDHLERADHRGRLVFPLPVIWPDARLTVAAAGHLPWREEDLSLSSLGDGSLVVPLHPAAGLSGRVVDGEGRPVAGAAVEVRADDTPWVSPGSAFAGSGWLAEGRDTRTGPDGGFTADTLPAGARLGVVARAPGFAPALRTLPPLDPHEVRGGIELVLSPGLRATGRVVDPTGEPVARAVVQVHRTHPATADSSREPGLLAGTAETDAEGRFELVDLSPGPARLRLAAPGRSGALPAEVDVEVPIEALAAPGGEREVDLGDLRLAPGYRIAGRVVDEDGAPVPGQSVEIRGYGDRRPGTGFEIARATTDADGAFAFEDRAAGEHELTVNRNKPPSNASAKVRPPGPDPAGETVVLVLRSGLRLSGRVVGSDGAPVAGAEVESRLRRGLTHPVSATTDGAGDYLLRGLEAGEHRLTVEAEGYLAESRRVVVADGADPAPADFELLGGTTLSGDVRWPDGRPAAGVRVYAQGVDGAGWSTPSRTTGPAGLFSVGPVPPGAADLVAVKRSVQVRQRIEVGPGPAPGSGPVTLTLPAGGRVSGRVVDTAGEPVAAAQVGLGSREAGGTWTGDDGRFVLVDVPPGAHRLVVDHPGYVEHRSEDRLEVEGADLEGLRVVLRRGAVVSGRVEGVEPGTARRVRVSLDRRDGPESLSVDADSAGRFRVERVPPGEYDAQARAGGVVATGSFTLPEGTESLEVELTPVTGSDLRGRVVQDGRPVVGVRVAVRTESRAVDDDTSGEGRFLLRRAPPAARTLEVDDPGGHTHQWELEAIEVSESGELHVELPAGRITGRVTDAASGEPLARATVYLETLADDAPEGPWRNRIERRIRADSRGIFVLYAVAPGRYRVRSEHEAPGPEPGQSLRLALREIEVTSEPVHDVDLGLGPAHRVVLRPTPPSDPAEGLGLQYALYDPEGRLERLSAAGADADGRVILDDLPEGDWRLWIGSYTTVLQGIDLRVPSDGEIPVALVEGGSVHFELPDELFGSRPVDLEVVLRDAHGRRPPGPPGETIQPFVIFDGPDHFPAEAGVGHLPPGPWTIELRHADGRAWKGKFFVGAGQSAEVTLVRVPPEPSV